MCFLEESGASKQRQKTDCSGKEGYFTKVVTESGARSRKYCKILAVEVMSAYIFARVTKLLYSDNAL